MARRPLLITSDQLLLDELLRLCAAAGVDPEVVSDPGAAAGGWAGAPLVLVGSDSVDALARLRLTHRPWVVLVGTVADDLRMWEQAGPVGAAQVAVLPEREEWLVGRLADAVDGNTRARIVSVVGGRGGAGASTLAGALAVTAARSGRSVLLVDGDPLGGGLDLLLGAEDCPGPRWPQLQAVRGRVAGSALRAALPAAYGVTVLSWDRGDLLDVPPGAMETVLRAARRGGDLVVVDLRRYVDEATRVALADSDVTLLVVPADVRAVAAAARVAAGVGRAAACVELVIRAPGPSGLSPDLVAETLALPVAGVVADEPGLSAALERGEPPARRSRSPLGRLCAELLERIERHTRTAA